MRVVSLVPSISEALATSCPESLVGVTDWCTHLAGLDPRQVARVRGTKNPDISAVAALRPDVVIANREENRELDVRRMREAGLRVWVSRIEDLPGAFTAYDELFDEVLERPRPVWLDQARALWSEPPPSTSIRVAIPIWRDPWMVIGSRTFAGDLVRRLGWHNVYAEHHDRYPHVELNLIDASGADLVVLPDEPYPFSAGDGPEAFSTPTRLVSGRLLTWYGPSLLQARALASF